MEFAAVRVITIGNITHEIWLKDMPNIRRIYILLNDIYIVRAFRQYRLEEDLFAKLIFLMRSRELAIKVTREYGNIYNPEFIYIKNRDR
ncbi:DUF3595 domain containing protein [Asbolus verrucosus]|uniref:DUF3595 domain containing protein n=1 Tax=Asbolus verrucosus TaxID=1661398 RepID=A0A482VXV0_ASBVE|nr:DUF3595 domain containing protein [Asbolus verrucosus]